jgi:membrane fusion protein, copper/silver efflux system
LLAVQAENTLGQSSYKDVSGGAKDLRSAALSRLKLLDVSEDQIQKLDETGEPVSSVTFYSPVSGYVIQKNVFEKQRVGYDTEAFTIADLSVVWLQADIYETDASQIRIGQSATATLTYRPGRKYTGKISAILPSVNGASRTLQARIEVPNSDGLLRPAMYANVEIQISDENATMIPEEAVLDSGERKIVYVKKEDGDFESREVQTGAHADGKVVVLSGLKAGETIARSGNFMLDSESQLKSSVESTTQTQHD